MLVSGLNVGSSWFDQLSIQMFVDYITGQLGGQLVSYRYLLTSWVQTQFMYVCMCGCVVSAILVSRISSFAPTLYE